MELHQLLFLVNYVWILTVVGHMYVGETITKRELEKYWSINFFYEPNTIFILVMLVCHKYRHSSVT